MHPLCPTGRISLRRRDKLLLLGHGCSRPIRAPAPATLEGPSRQSPGQVYLRKSQTNSGSLATLPKAGHPSFYLSLSAAPGRKQTKQGSLLWEVWPKTIFITKRTETWQDCNPRARCPRMDFRECVTQSPASLGMRRYGLDFTDGEMKPRDNSGIC